jgi:hypothetical protein
MWPFGIIGVATRYMNERPGAHERGRLQEQCSWAKRGSRRFERGGRSFLECEQIYSKVFSSDDEETLDAEMRAQTVGEKEEERAHVHVHEHMIPSSPFINKGHDTARW